jgi:hypothetical protein
MVALPSLSKFSSVSAILNRVEPQSKQTNISEKVRIPGFSRCLRPLKWIIISAVNSASFVEEHSVQLIASPTPPLITHLTANEQCFCSFVFFTKNGYAMSADNCDRGREPVPGELIVWQ